MSINKGDLVHISDWDTGGMVGIVLEVEVMKDIYKDSSGIEPMYSVTVLWEREVPSWLGEGRITTVTDSVLKVVQR